MTATWVDFRELRAKLRFADVLKSYNVELKVKGERASGFCPLPGHPPHNGKRRSPSFSANLARGIFQCFGCGAKGNVLDFALLMNGGEMGDSQKLREVALKLRDQFLGNGNDAHSATERKAPAPVPAKPGKSANGAQQKPSEGQARPVIVNAPLDFTLKVLDVDHPYLKQRGFTQETISYFGLGYCSRGLMQGRIVIPLHDSRGQLIGYAGRLVDDGNTGDENPKYRFPGDRERQGIVRQFKKSLFLYNGHRITAPVTDLVVVEGFASVWWLTQHGYADTVALMGSTCSPQQASLIAEMVTADGRIWAFPDGDDAGDHFAASVFANVGVHRFVRRIPLNDGEQPTDCALDELSALLPSEFFEGRRGVR